MYTDVKGISLRSIEQELGFSNGLLSGAVKNNRTLGADKIEQILRAFTDLNPNWLFLGEEPMILATTPKYYKAEEPVLELKEPLSLYSSRKIPLVDIDAFAGTGSDSFAINEADIRDYYIIPDFQNISFMLRVKGVSMYPKYMSGDIVACRIISSNAFIQWGKSYVIATLEQGIMVKRIKRSLKNDHFELHSDNPSFDPFDIPAPQITGLALVVGLLRLE